MAARVPLFNLKPVVTPEQITAAVETYFDEHPGTTDEPLLLEHISDPTPHPAYDNLSAGRFVTYLQNGMS